MLVVTFQTTSELNSALFLSVVILEKIKKKEGFILKKTKELKFLKKFRDEIKSVTDQLDDFDKNKELKGDFIEALDRYFIHVYKMVRDDTIPLEYFLESYDIYL